MYYEASEKKIEITLKQGARSLKSMPKSFWESLIKDSGCRVLSAVSSPLCDSYLLSESSLFVFPQKFTMVTGARSSLLPVIKSFFEEFSPEELDSFYYMRKNEVHLEDKRGQFYQDAEELSRLMPGQACRFANSVDKSTYLFYLDRASQLVKTQSGRLELMAYSPTAEVKDIFSQGKSKIRKWMSDNEAFANFFESYDVQDYAFEPFGYSLNAVKGDRYFCFHVNPETRGNFLSFEGQCEVLEAEKVFSALRELLKAKTYQAMYFTTPQETGFLDSLELAQESTRLKRVLSNGVELSYINLIESNTKDLVEEIPLTPRITKTTVALPDSLSMFSEDWVFEKNNSIAQGVLATQKLFEAQEENAKVEILHSEAWGKILLAQKKFIYVEKSDNAHFEMMAHVPLFVHPNPNRVLAMGRSGLFVAREVLKHSSVNECFCVGLEKMEIEAMQEHFPWVEELLTEPRFHAVETSPLKFLAETQEIFDLLLIDQIESQDFYSSLKRILTPGSMVLISAGSPYLEMELQTKLKATLTPLFEKVFFYNYPNFMNIGAMGTFCYVSDTFHPLEEFDKESFVRLNLDLKYYNAEIHYASFFLPSFQKKALAAAVTKAVKTAISEAPL